jgi:hypothetical protein
VFTSILWSPAVDNYYEYLRTFSQELGARIVEMYPPLQGPNDPLPTALETLLRQPLPAQALTISGVAKHLKTARPAIIVGECGTGKTLMSVAVAHAAAAARVRGAELAAADPLLTAESPRSFDCCRCPGLRSA